MDNPNTNGFCGLCLAPVDLAVSKLAAGRPKDLDYVRILLCERTISLDHLLKAIPSVLDWPTDRKEAMVAAARRLAA